ncbi:MAG TPA: hypothetical protein VHH90_02660 [Polyangia bacterium]|nr:hypothetical protein [Polyangia bacterium]
MEPLACHVAVTLNRSLAAKLIPFAEEADEIGFSDVGGSYVRVRAGRRQIFGLKRQAEFPQMNDMMTARGSSVARFATAELLNATDVLRIVDEDAPVRVEANRDKLLLSVRTSAGNISHSIPCESDGAQSRHVVSLRALRAACQSLDADTLRVSGLTIPHPAMRLEDEANTAAWILATHLDDR